MHPLLVRHLLFPLHERLKGKRTFPWLRELERTQWLAPDALREYQFRRLKNHLDWAYAHVPYYRALFDNHGLPPARITSFDDFRRLPFLTREVLRSRFEDLRATINLPNVKRLSTGGSTGVPVTLEVDMERMGIGEAARLRAHRWFGVEPGEREIVLWGSPIETARQDKIRQVRDWLLNSRLLSAFDMGEDALARHARAVASFRPRKMYGYASAFHLLARYFQREHLPPPPGLRAVFTTAEPLFPFQRETIESAFGCRVATEYGSRDGGLVALECPKGGLHIFAEGMYVEVVDTDSEARGEIVVTCLDSPAFPIIRYRTGDIGGLDATPCSCGRSLPKLRNVEGRQTDFLVTPDGRILHALAVIYILRDMRPVREFRVVQISIEEVTVQMVTDRPMRSSEEAELRARFAALLGDSVRVELEHLDRLPRSPSGKFRYVESRVAGEVVDRSMARRA
jgi:phenylacetate-CoA ligase